MSVAELVIGVGGRPGVLTRIERMLDAAPIAWRPTTDAVYMVGSCASPVGDDQVDIRVQVLAGARATIRSVAASVAWAGSGSHHRVAVDVEEGASLDWRPEPLIATRACHHTQTSTIRLGKGAKLRWQEVLVLGRHEEQPGWLRSALSVDGPAGPLLRHECTSGIPSAQSPAVLGQAKAVGFFLLVGGVALSEGLALPGGQCVASPLERGGVLVTSVGDTPGVVMAALARASELICPSP